MKYIIQDETKLKKYYYAVDGVIFNISSLKKCDETINFKNEDIFVTLTYKSKLNDSTTVTKYINLENYVKCGDKLVNGKLQLHDCSNSTNKTLFDILKEEQENELFQKILNGSVINNVYNSLPDFFRWEKNGDEIETKDKDFILTNVYPSVYIPRLVEGEGENKHYTDYLINIFKNEAIKVGTERVNFLLKEINKEVEEITLGDIKDL